MVIKTDVCSFSEYRIYPGKGTKFVRRDGQIVTFFSSKMASLYHQKKKPAKLTWTLAWRRLNKKEAKLDLSKKKKKRVVKILRPIVGVSTETIKKKRAEKPEVRQDARDAALKEVKLRQQKKAGKK